MNATRWIICAVVVITLAIDVVLAMRLGVEGTISVQITAWSHEYPIIGVLFGVMIGHFFTQNKKGTAPQ